MPFPGLLIMLLLLLLLMLVLLASAIMGLREYERGVIFRLGRLVGSKGAGLILLIPLIDRMVRVRLRTVAMDIPPQDVITKDNVSVKVNHFRISTSFSAFSTSNPVSWRNSVH